MANRLRCQAHLHSDTAPSLFFSANHKKEQGPTIILVLFYFSQKYVDFVWTYRFVDQSPISVRAHMSGGHRQHHHHHGSGVARSFFESAPCGSRSLLISGDVATGVQTGVPEGSSRQDAHGLQASQPSLLHWRQRTQPPGSEGDARPSQQTSQSSRYGKAPRI